ncbi:MAG: hypothetical protein GDA48_07450 [Hormoscilla sp. GM102CHS1]|nr:hypothetical protein [Hormoscilla sp. GM102CHS1]
MKEISAPKPINPWDYKPWWCQPWSIILTGITIISISWFLFRIIWISIIVSVPVCAWMSFFLLIWPPLMRNMLASYPRASHSAIGGDRS